jgi:hypothetical protein
VQDWRRIILSGDFSVEEGHQSAKESIAREITRLRENWSFFTGNKLTDPDWIKALSEPPSSDG